MGIIIVFALGFPWGSAGKESAHNAGDLGSVLGLGTSPGEGNSYPLQYSGLENSMDLYHPWGHKELDTTERLSLTYLPHGIKRLEVKIGHLGEMHSILQSVLL